MQKIKPGKKKPKQAMEVGDYPYSTWQQVEAFLAQNYGLSGLRIDPGLIGRVEALAGDNPVTISIRGREITNAFLTGRMRKPVGLAVDLGTTKIAGFLVDLETGITLAAEGILNPQIAYGEDVISRLAYALEKEEQYSRITQVLREGLDRQLHTLCGAEDVVPERRWAEEIARNIKYVELAAMPEFSNNFLNQLRFPG